MWRTVLTLALSVLATGLPARAMAGERYALLVGVKQYNKNELTSLDYTENDVTVFGELLLDKAAYKQVVIMTQSKAEFEPRYLPTATNIRRELKAMLAACKPDDMIVVALAGHGVQFQGSDEPYFCPMDATLKDKSRKTLISLKEVYEELAKCKAEVKVLLSDACRNDPLSQEAKASVGKTVSKVAAPASKREPPRNVVAFFSCSAGDVAYESPNLGLDPKTKKPRGHGVFFHFLIEGVKGRATPGSQQVTLNALTEYVQLEVGRYVRNTLRKKEPQQPEVVSRVNRPVVLADLVPEGRIDRTAAQLRDLQRRAVELYREKDYRGVIDHANRAMKLGPKSEQTFFFLALRASAYELLAPKVPTREKQRQYREAALADANRSTEMNPKFSEPYYTRGNIYRSQNKPEKAIEEYTRALERFERHFMARYFRGVTYFEMKEYDKAREDFTETIAIHGKFARGYFNRALIHVAVKNEDEALKDLQHAIDSDPKFAGAYRQRALVLSRRGTQDARTKAVADLTRAIELNKDYALAYADRGLLLAGTNRDAALRDYDTAIRLNKQDYLAYYGRGLLYLRDADKESTTQRKAPHLQKALDDFSSAIRLKGDHMPSRYFRAVVFVTKKDHQTAIIDLNQCIRLAPRDDRSWNLRGAAYSWQKQWRLAIRDYSEAIRLNGRVPLYYENRAKALKAVKRDREAEQDLATARALRTKTVQRKSRS